MESDGSPISSLGPDEASRLLKDILNVGKSQSTSAGETSTASLASDLKGAIDGLDSSVQISADESSANNINGSTTYADLLQSIGEVPQQQIVLHGDDSSNSFSVYGRDVNVVASAASALTQTTPGSNKVKISPVVNYDWEHRYHIGHLVSIHRSNLHVAYVLRGKSGGIVRVINRKTAERVLLKGFVGQVVDLAFAHLSNVILGAVDELGTMFIYEILEKDGKIWGNLLLHVNRPSGTVPSTNHRLIWCPFIPEAETSEASEPDTSEDSGVDDASKLLVLTHNEVVEMWNVDVVNKEYGSGPLEPSEVHVGFLTIDHHSQPVVDASYSPDGTALATASLDGEVKFFQVYLQDKSPPRCLHQWQPHNGQPVSSLFFLDDHKYPDPEVQFWKFAVTGANHNQEIKIWSCETWSCLQTLTFTAPSPDTSGRLQAAPCLKAALDLSANYLLLSDIKRKVLYVLHLHQDPKTGSTHVSSLSEFLLTQPCLSMSILDASRRKFKQSPDLQDNDHEAELTTGELQSEGEEEEEVAASTLEDPNIGVLVQMYSVHTRALQELRIRFCPKTSVLPNAPLNSTSFSQDDIIIKDQLSDMSLVSEMDSVMSSRRSGVGSDKGTDRSRESTGSNHPPVLLTPEAFTSPRNIDPVRSSGGSSHSSLTAVTALDDDMRTPHTSLASGQAVSTSPSSSLTLTPVSSRDFSKQDERPCTPPQSPQKDFVTSSPARHHGNTDFLPPANVSFSKEEDEEEKVVDSSRESSVEGSARQKLQSTGSSSSASLEVSEILEGAKKPGVEMPYEEEEEEEKTRDQEDAAQNTPEEEEEEKEEEEEEESVKDRPEYDSRIWPKAPVVSSNDEDLSLEARMLAAEAIHRAAAVAQQQNFADVVSSGEVEARLSTSSNPSKPVVYDSPPVSSSMASEDHGEETAPTPVNALDHAAIQQLQASMQSMLGLLQQQGAEIEQLRSQLREQRDQTHSMQTLQEHIENLEAVLSSKVAGALDLHSQTEAERLQLALGERASQDKAKHDQLLTTLTRTLERTVSAKLEKTVRDEMRNVVLPTVGSLIEPIKTQLHNELAQKLTATDALMKESIGKLVRSKPTIESIGNAVGGAMQGPLQSACRDVLVPSFDRGCSQMFQQMNAGFQRGVHQYTEQLETHLEKVRRRHEESRDPIVQQLHGLVEGLKAQEAHREPIYQQMTTLNSRMDSTANCIKALSADIDGSVKRRMKSMEDNLQGGLRQIVQEEVGVALQNQQASLSDQLITAVRSRAVTPVNHNHRPSDPQHVKAMIVQLLHQGELNSAFQHALSASDLSLVIFVCETVNPSQVFDQTPCPLQQPVLLSLIQQLSADFQSNLDIKLKYLQETLMNLDQSNAVTREHMPTVVSQLVQKLNTFIQANPRHPMSREIRMLVMACRSFVK